MEHHERINKLEKILSELKKSIILHKENDDIILNLNKQVENLYIRTILQLCLEKIDNNLTKDTQYEIERVKGYFKILDKYKDTVINDKEFIDYLYKKYRNN